MITFEEARKLVRADSPHYKLATYGYQSDADWFVFPFPETAGGRIAAVSKTAGKIRWINENADEYREDRPVGERGEESLTSALQIFHLPGKHNQKDHGHAGFGEGALHGQAALSSAALAVEPNAGQAAALRRMGGDGAYVVNKDLRAHSGAAGGLTDRNRGTVEEMDSLMKSSPLASDMIVYRRAQVRDVFGSDVEHVGDLTGLSWHDHAYISTSTEPRADLSGSLNMRILAPAGTPGFSHPELDPDEILLGRGLTFEVVADHRGENVGGPVDVLVHP